MDNINDLMLTDEDVSDGLDGFEDFEDFDSISDLDLGEQSIQVMVNGRNVLPFDWQPKYADNIGKSLVEWLNDYGDTLEDEEFTGFVEHLKTAYNIDYAELLQEEASKSDEDGLDLDSDSDDIFSSGGAELNLDGADLEEFEDFDTFDEQPGDRELTDNREDIQAGDLPLDNFDTPNDSQGNDLDTFGADHDGTILDSDALLTDGLDFVDPNKDFMSETGEIVIMDTNDNGDGFKMKYIDIESIAVVKRIRKETTNVEDLVQSIKSTGLLEPLVVTPTQTEGLYVLLAGYRRLVACAKAGKRKIPCVVNLNANTPEIPILEALYNHSKTYTIKEIVDYIDYLEKQKGVMSASMIEYLLQLNSGDYTKLKDILNDDDEDIVSKLFDGVYTIEIAFKKLEQRRKKESAEEKDNKKAAKVYEDEAESGAASIAGSGDETNENEALTDDEIKSLSFSVNELDDEDDEQSSLDEMVEDGKHMDGFEPNKQDYRDRERLDPTLRRAVLARDNNTCKCCLMSGQEYTEIFDIHHIVEVYLGGSDDITNLVTLCTCCHKLVHLYARGELQIRPESELSTEEQAKFKKIVKLGKVIRKGMQMKGMKKEELKKVDKADTIGRTKPGTGQVAG